MAYIIVHTAWSHRPSRNIPFYLHFLNLIDLFLHDFFKHMYSSSARLSCIQPQSIKQLLPHLKILQLHQDKFSWECQNWLWDWKEAIIHDFKQWHTILISLSFTLNFHVKWEQTFRSEMFPGTECFSEQKCSFCASRGIFLTWLVHAD
jgi:hypothetical protein